MSVTASPPHEPPPAICGVVEAACICHKQPGHVEAGDDVHECDQRRCTGAWKGSGEDFMIVRLPFAVGEPTPWAEGMLP